MHEELKVLEIVAQRLNDASITYMLSGSMAANFYTIPRMTRDIDIVVELTGTDTVKFVNLFAKDFYVDQEAVQRAASAGGIFNLIHNASVIKIDFIAREVSAYQDCAFSRRRNFTVEGRAISVVSPEDLVIAKLRWAKESLSEMQLRDVKNIFRTVKDIDVPYIEKWVATFGLEYPYSRVKT